MPHYQTPALWQAKAASTGAWSDSRSSPCASTGRAAELPALAAPTARGGSTTSRPRASRWSIASGRSAPRARNGARARRTPATTRGRRLKSPPRTSGRPRANRRRRARPPRRTSCSACCAVAGGRVQVADAQLARRRRRAPTSAIRRRSRSPRRGSGLSSTASRSAIRHGGRTSVTFEPPSHDAIRSGFQRASAPPQRRELVARGEHAVRARRRSARASGRPSAAAPPGAGRPTSRAAAITSANSSSSGRFTCTCVALRSVVRSRRDRQREEAAVGRAVAPVEEVPGERRVQLHRRSWSGGQRLRIPT